MSTMCQWRLSQHRHSHALPTLDADPFGLRFGGWVACVRRAGRYNNSSIMEAHSCAAAYKLINTPATDPLSGFTKAERRAARTLIIDCVMATNLSHHGEILIAFNEHLQASVQNLSSLTKRGGAVLAGAGPVLACAWQRARRNRLVCMHACKHVCTGP